MKIKLKKLDGWNAEVVVNEHTETITQLKQKAISALRNTQLTIDQIRLIFQGNEITEEYFRNTGIRNGDTVMAVVKERVFIRLFVEEDGQKIQLEVEESELVENVKRMIYERKGYAMQEQVLMFNGREIGGGRLNHYHVAHDSVLQLYFKTFNIIVKDFNGKSHAFQVKLSDTVDTLKSKVKDMTGVVPGQQNLTHQGRTMQSGHVLREYDIQENSTIHLVGRLRGG